MTDRNETGERVDAALREVKRAIVESPPDVPVGGTWWEPYFDLIASELQNLRTDARVLATQRDAARTAAVQAHAEADAAKAKSIDHRRVLAHAERHVADMRGQLHDLATEVARWPRPPEPVRFACAEMTESGDRRSWWVRLEDDGTMPDEEPTWLARSYVTADDAEQLARENLAAHGWREEMGAEVGRLLVLQYERGRADEGRIAAWIEGNAECPDTLPGVLVPGADERDLMPLTLGELAAWLGSLPSDARVRDLGGPCSYCGDYRQVAFEPTDQTIAAGALAQRVREVVGRTFGGWKGGEFDMHEGCDVYLAECGQSGAPRVTRAYFLNVAGLDTALADV